MGLKSLLNKSGIFDRMNEIDDPEINKTIFEGAEHLIDEFDGDDKAAAEWLEKSKKDFLKKLGDDQEPK